jgi:HSP20 family protein
MWPYRGGQTVWRPLGDLFSEVQRALHPWWRFAETTWRGSSNFPPVRITSTDDTLILTAEIPGIKLSDLDLTITGDALTIKGERRPDETVAEASYHRRERLTGHFARSVTLPERVDPDRITASYTDGVLWVTMPKAPEARTRKIDVAVT